MPVLENPKHEVYAQHLAKGMKQQDAYAHAGYPSRNSSAASRLAKTPELQARVEEIKDELFAKVKDMDLTESADDYQTLQEMGLTMNWVAAAYKNVYNIAIQNEDLGPANTAIANIQKLVEAERSGRLGEGADDQETRISLSELTGFIEAYNEMRSNDVEREEMKDVTPTEGPTVNTAALLEAFSDDEDEDN